MEKTFDVETIIFVVSLKDINHLRSDLSKEEILDSKLSLIEKSYDLIEYINQTEVFDYNYEEQRKYSSNYLCELYPILEYIKHNISYDLIENINFEVGSNVLVPKPNKNYHILKKRKNGYLRTIKD